MVKILLIEYESTEKEVFKKFLSEGSFENSLHWARSITKARSILKKEDFDVIFCNFNLPDGTALEFIEDNIIIEESPFIILSSEIEVKHAIRCIKLGAFDMVAKENLNAGEIDKLITNAQRRRKEDKLRNDLERRLDENYANTRAFLDNTTDGMWSLNSEGTLLMINQIAKTNLKSNFSHYPKIGEKFFDHISEEFKAKWQPLFETALKGKNVQSIDEFFINDQFFVIECSCSPISSKKEIKGATFFAREVTERITQQKKLIENERNFRSIFQNSDVPILVESRTDNKIIDLNEACAHLHGYKVSEMMGMGIFQTIPPEHRTESQENYNLYKSGAIDVLDTYIYTSTKKSIPVQISVAEIEFNGIPSNLIFYQDISRRKETERTLEAAKTLAEKSAKFKSQFLANMSHEIRTPLNALIGFADLLDKSDLDKSQKEFVNTIQKSGEDLMFIINDILDLSKIEAGKMSLRTQEFDLNNLLHKVDNLFNLRASEKGLKLKISKDDNVPNFLIGDDLRISQILYNLVTNAIKFTENGEIKVSVSLIEKESDLFMCEFKVKDTGVGISEKDLSNIFTNFSQVDSSFQRKHQGTGLGLSIAKNLSELMQGTLEVKSKLNEGSEFVITIPLKKGSKLVKTDTNPQIDTDLSELKVLICEDHDVNTLLVEKVMSRLGVKYICAKNGQEGLNLVSEFKPDIILMDLQMPVLDGYATTIEIRKSLETPIYAMSAHVLEEEREKCEEIGMNGFITKPFKEDNIKNILALTLQNKLNNPIKSKWENLELPNLVELADGDEEFISNLFSIYLKNTAIELEKIKQAHKDNDISVIKKSAHKLKPSFITFQLMKLHAIAENLEDSNTMNEQISFFISLLSQSLIDIKKKEKTFNS